MLTTWKSEGLTLLVHSPAGAHGSPSLDSTAGWFGTDMPAQGPPSGPASAGGAVQQGLADLREGWRYMCAPGNR